jgi:hypothetical protein
MLWVTEDGIEYEFLQDKEAEVSILKEVRLEVFPNDSPLPI